MAKKRLLVFSTQLMETGGIESHVKEFLTQMAATGKYTIDLVVLNAQISEQQRQDLRKLCSKVYLPTGKGLSQKLSFLLMLVRFSVGRYDALYTNGQGNSVRLISRIFKHKTWVHHHHTSGDFADQQTWTLDYKAALQKADVVVACSNKNARDMSKVLARSIISIPCFSKKIDIEKSPVANRLVHFGYYGRLIPEKGIDLLCQLSEDRDLKNTRFHIWGEGEKYPPDFFKKYPQLHFHGKFSGLNELKEVFKIIDGYLLLSVHPEGLPISLLELMSAGIPWMATDKGGISDIVCDPKSTRLLSSLEPYDVLKNAVLSFAADISGGEINTAQQKALYNKKFAAPVLMRAWQDVLFKPSMN